jgi:hypothetical protein
MCEKSVESYSQACQDKFVLGVTKYKTNGCFLEIGAGHPILTSNTYTLEKNYNWKGIMVDYSNEFKDLYKEHRPNSFHIIDDATNVDYKHVFELNNMPTNIDYLQIDLDVNNRSTLTTLEILNNYIFDKHKFAAITFEHDVYTGNYFDTREKSREILNKRGYVCVFPDVCHEWKVFEDWYVHPELVDMEHVVKIVSQNVNKYFVHDITGKAIYCESINYE